MSFVALVLVLALEQWRPFQARPWLEAVVGRCADWLEHQFDAGQVQHGVVAWSLLVLPVIVLVGAAGYVLGYLHWTLALLFHVGVLYVTMGFRQGSHFFTEIRQALAAGDLPRARATLARWRGSPCESLDGEEIVRLSVEQALIGAHRLVFAVMFWYVLLPGPTGAVLYRLSQMAAERWSSAPQRVSEPFLRPALAVFRVLDALPARVTASAFAIVGDFEDAVFCWRSQAAAWADHVAGVILASGAGALGVKLGMPLHAEIGGVDDRPPAGLGDEADPAHLDSTIGLIWRALVLWLGLILMLTVARSFG